MLVRNDRKKRLLLIINPCAGRRQAEAERDFIVAAFRDDYEVQLHLTEQQGDATRLVQQFADDQDLIVCCGGDGTLNEVVSGQLQKGLRIPIGYIPTGTTNDMARTLGLPRDIGAAVEVIRSGSPFYQDVGILNGDIYFTYVASFGAFTEVSYATSQDLKNRFGYGAYLIHGLSSINTLHPYPVRVTTEQGEIDGDFLFGFVTNSTSVAGILKLDEEAVGFNDGMYEVMLIRSPASLLDLKNSLGNLIWQQYNEPNVYFFHAQHIRFEFESDVPWTLDGEYGGHLRTADIAVRRNAYRIMRREIS